MHMSNDGNENVSENMDGNIVFVVNLLSSSLLCNVSGDVPSHLFFPLLSSV